MVEARDLLFEHARSVSCGACACFRARTDQNRLLESWKLRCLLEHVLEQTADQCGALASLEYARQTCLSVAQRLEW
jgi:hypothetical protein